MMMEVSVNYPAFFYAKMPGNFNFVNKHIVHNEIEKSSISKESGNLDSLGTNNILSFNMSNKIHHLRIKVLC